MAVVRSFPREEPVRLYNRRTFIKTVGFFIIGLFLFLWQQLISKHLSLTGKKGTRKVDLINKVDGIYFFESFLVVKKGAALTVLNNRCTHAGCKINQEHNGEIVCACHGSTYDASGKVIKGPASKPLRSMKYYTDSSNGQITVIL